MTHDYRAYHSAAGGVVLNRCCIMQLSTFVGLTIAVAQIGVVLGTPTILETRIITPPALCQAQEFICTTTSLGCDTCAELYPNLTWTCDLIPSEPVGVRVSRPNPQGFSTEAACQLCHSS